VKNKGNFNVVQADFVNRSCVPVRRQWIRNGELFDGGGGAKLALSWENDSAIPELCIINDNGIKLEFGVEMNSYSVFGAMGTYFRRVAVAWNPDKVTKRILLEFSYSLDSVNSLVPSRY